MYDITSQFFWYKLLFVIELIISESFFSFGLKRKAHFVGRYVGSCIFLLLLALVIPQFDGNAISMAFFFIGFFLLSVLLMMFCLKENWWNVIFCAIAAYSTRHMAYTLFVSLNDLVFYVLGLMTGISAGFDPYGAPLLEILSSYSLITLLLYALSYFLIFWGAWHIYLARLYTQEDLKINSVILVFLAGTILLIDIVLSFVTEYNEAIDPVSIVVERLYNFLSCFLALGLLFSQLEKKNLGTKLDTVEQMLYEQAKQYEMTKKTIDIINIKCHDLKHQIHQYREKNNADEFEEIENAVDIYASVVKTGNEALDVILTEKSLYCEKNKISLTSIADGEALSFLRSSDLYSLFGNALDNAIEAVEKLPAEQRNISLSVKKFGKIVAVRVENPYDGVLLPNAETRKQEKDWHGFGILSIQTITEKYGGTLSIETERNMFRLNLLFFV
ncbi:MAG: GHKL domain-containing protein [Clostridia bacterium]|nr:GHKL domain-containing protein [Clostridia bacterium]